MYTIKIPAYLFNLQGFHNKFPVIQIVVVFLITVHHFVVACQRHVLHIRGIRDIYSVTRSDDPLRIYYTFKKRSGVYISKL